MTTVRRYLFLKDAFSGSALLKGSILSFIINVKVLNAAFKEILEEMIFTKSLYGDNR
ncbi:MAG: hypothetical protein ABI366_11325 [Ginsengibacter sp.]